MFVKPRIGLVLGKFMPLHKGHEYLIRFAKQYCDQLVVVVDCLEHQTISTDLRKSWILELVTGVRVVALTECMPQDPSETPRFWEIWRDALYTAVGSKPDVLIAAMDYGWKLADTLECAFVQCDIARESVPISATQLRDNPMAHWEYLAEPARGYFMKKVCFMGPESTGKSTCALKLARALGTVYVPEYAKALIQAQNGRFTEENVLEVAFAQHRSDKALERMVNRVMVCDTDPLTTLVWSEVLYGRHPAELDMLVIASRVDHTFLFEPTTAWVPAEHRNILPAASDPDVRKAFFDACEHWLKQFDRAYSVIGGGYADRFEACLAKSQELISRVS